ncbi:MAG: VOC family protein [Solirubrobacterales bacterium]|nr:VOC family protein [Solirubrobacterales bacterium]
MPADSLRPNAASSPADSLPPDAPSLPDGLPADSAPSLPDGLPADSAPSLPDGLRLGPVELTVADLTRAVAWYEEALGLVVHEREDGRARLGDGRTVVLVLHEDPAATPPGRGHAGLFHYALLFPSREELARAALRLSATSIRSQGASDHETHEAIYLADADGNGIELAADRPRAAWPEHLGYANGPQPLDVGSLMATIEGEAPQATVGEGLRVGHLHLHVGDIEEGLAFYRDTIGFALRASLGSAAFVSAGGYHHHLGFNVWNGHGVGAPPPHTVGLRAWTVLLDAPAIAALRDRLERAGHHVDDAPEGGEAAAPGRGVAAAQAAGVEGAPRGFLVRDPWGTPLHVASG